MLSRGLLAMFASLQMLSSHMGEAIPLDHELVKRADINCRPIDPYSELDFIDCVRTIRNILDGKTRAEKHQLQWFGSTPVADVRFRSLLWASGTCNIRIDSEEGVDQQSSWSAIVTVALRIAVRCVRNEMPGQQGDSYVDRRASDPHTSFFGPSLRVFITPRASPPTVQPTESSGSNTQQVCPVKQPANTTEVPGCSWDMESTANSYVGGGSGG
ncbi:hypothetical protein N7G274_001033 [Stereocaulon virgatum]|uniref:Uncharacterized protein n=1 Tax=Stereocaulon virgatum TaxID=373712 RepID=A0ABR4AMP9_9LECA